MTILVRVAKDIYRFKTVASLRSYLSQVEKGPGVVPMDVGAEYLGPLLDPLPQTEAEFADLEKLESYLTEIESLPKIQPKKKPPFRNHPPRRSR